MKKILAACALAALAAVSAHAQTAASATPTQGGAGARQDRLIGEVTAIDPAAGRVTVKSDAGESVSAAFDEKTIFLRVAPGAKTIEGAAKITRAEVATGDRVLVLLRAGGAEGAGSVARQLVVMSREAIAERREQEREEARRRRLVGRVASVDAARREVIVTTRGREGAEQQIIISAAEGTRVLRFAPDSMRPADAVASSFAELKAGDQVRARGERSADGARFTAEEILAGQFVRVGGTVMDVNAARGEVIVKNEQTGKTVTVVLAKKSTLRRVPAEFAESFAERRGAERRQASEAERAERRQMTDAERRARREERRRERAAQGQQGQRAGGDDQRRRGGGGGGNFQQAFENFPAVAATELKKGDAVLVTGTPGADQSSVTAITLVTGDAEFLRRLQRIQGRQDGEARGMSPGLPGDVLGGGNVNRDQPREQP